MDIARLPPPIHIAASQHNILPKQVSSAAREVVSILQKAGFQAYIVGGGVRDLLLGHHPKDFDVATDARPEQIKPLFKRCFLIGRRFRLAHVHLHHQVIEVATFRGSTPLNEPPAEDEMASEIAQEHHTHETTGMVLRDNIYGSLVEDAWRRDFSINALYYNPANGEITDFTNGFEDLKNRSLRIIGDATQRYREDPVRMLRAIRFMGKLHFDLHSDTAAPIPSLAHLLSNIPAARLFEEFNKLFMHGHALRNYHLLQEYQLLKILLPQTAAALSNEHIDTKQAQDLIEGALRNTDMRVKKDKPVTPAFLFASLLWPAYVLSSRNYQIHHHQSPYFASISATSEVIGRQVQQIAIPRRLSVFIRETWQLQPRLVYLRKRNVARCIRHPRFRAAYDFLLLRAAAGEPLQAVADWWTNFQQANEEERQRLLGHMPTVKEPAKESATTSSSEKDHK